MKLGTWKDPRTQVKVEVETLKDEGVSFHVLRYEFTTRMIEAGWSMAETQATTGHSTAEMLRRYTHVIASDIAAKARSKQSQ